MFAQLSNTATTVSHLNSIGQNPVTLDTSLSQCALKSLFVSLSCIYQLFAVIVNPDKMMTFGGTPEPAAVCSLTSIGKLTLDDNKQYIKLICGMLNKHLGIPAER